MAVIIKGKSIVNEEGVVALRCLSRVIVHMLLYHHQCCMNKLTLQGCFLVILPRYICDSFAWIITKLFVFFLLFSISVLSFTPFPLPLRLQSPATLLQQWNWEHFTQTDMMFHQCFRYVPIQLKKNSFHEFVSKLNLNQLNYGIPSKSLIVGSSKRTNAVKKRGYFRVHKLVFNFYSTIPLIMCALNKFWKFNWRKQAIGAMACHATTWSMLCGKICCAPNHKISYWIEMFVYLIINFIFVRQFKIWNKVIQKHFLIVDWSEDSHNSTTVR